jgi:glycogen phosphorylase
MKLSLNGALTIGTLDGANIEIRERVGAENLFIFGLKADEVAARRVAGIDATADIEACAALAGVLDALDAGSFSPDDRSRYKGLVENLRHHDFFMVCADFEAYRASQRDVAALWRDPGAWWRRAILNTAGMGWFSADRAILDYAREIWRADPGAG